MGIFSDAVKIFQKFGYTVGHQTGSHIILYQPAKATLSIPNHKELAPGLLRGLIRKSGITVDELKREIAYANVYCRFDPEVFQWRQ